MKFRSQIVLFPNPHPTRSLSRVVVTGAGIITSLGRGWSENASGFREGRIGIGPVTLFDVTRQRAKVAAQVNLPPNSPCGRLSSARVRRLDRAGRMLLIAAEEALTQSAWTAPEHLPTVIGTTSGGMALGETFYRQAITPNHSNRQQPTRVISYQAQRQALDLCEAFGLGGPVTLIANACASGANAIGHAWELVRHNHAERVLTGGYDALCQLVFSGFDSLQALSLTRCRPFDAGRDGLAIGEGAAMLALETLESARRRGAVILGELVGYGASTDCHHLTQPHPNGDAALLTMRAACECAGVRPDQIGYVNAHGTGTLLNDSAEATAINNWAGSHAGALPVSSTKSSIGHLLGAAGAVEAVICLMALQEHWLPPTSTLEKVDPACGFPVVNQPQDARFEYALSNSFGFGGANATLIFRRWS